MLRHTSMFIIQRFDTLFIHLRSPCGTEWPVDCMLVQPSQVPFLYQLPHVVCCTNNEHAYCPQVGTCLLGVNY